MEDLKNETKWWVIVFIVLVVFFLLTFLFQSKKPKVIQEENLAEQEKQVEELKEKVVDAKKGYDQTKVETWDKYVVSKVQTRTGSVSKRMDIEISRLLSEGKLERKGEGYQIKKDEYQEAKEKIKKQKQYSEDAT